MGFKRIFILLLTTCVYAAEHYDFMESVVGIYAEFQNVTTHGAPPQAFGSGVIVSEMGT